MPAAAATDYAPADYAAVRPVELMVSAAVVQDGKQHQHRHRDDGNDEILSGGGDFSGTTCGYRSAPNAADHETFVRDAVHLMLEQAVFRGTDRRRPVLNWKSPEELRATFDFELNRSATTHGHLLHLIEDTIENSVKTGHPYFINQLFSRYVPIIIINDIMSF